MEIHKHPHHITHKKKWAEYLLEFLMLFLAVFLGFVAENIREHEVEKEREKVYIQNLYEDLKSDSAAFLKYKKNNLEFFQKIDSLVVLIKRPDRKVYLDKIYFLARTATMRSSQIFPNERTFDEMKSAGLLRLIASRPIADSVSSYYNSLRNVISQNEFILQRIRDYMQPMGKIFDAERLLTIFKTGHQQPSDSLKLLTEDPIIINELLVSAQYLYGACIMQNNWVIDQENSAKNLISLIDKEYHL